MNAPDSKLAVSVRDENDWNLRSRNRSAPWSPCRSRHAHRGEGAFAGDARAGLHAEFSGWQIAQPARSPRQMGRALFYPKDFTSGCTKEAHSFQRDRGQYEQKNALILGVSVQDEVTHQKFCAKEGLSFKLLADTKYEVSSSYDSLVNLGVAKLSARHTFLIDPDGIVRKVYLNVDAEKHSTEVLADLAQLQHRPG